MIELTLGFTTRRWKESISRDAFNMARYIDDEPSYVTHHQEILANAINFLHNNGFSYSNTRK